MTFYFRACAALCMVSRECYGLPFGESINPRGMCRPSKYNADAITGNLSAISVDSPTIVAGD